MGSFEEFFAVTLQEMASVIIKAKNKKCSPLYVGIRSWEPNRNPLQIHQAAKNNNATAAQYSLNPKDDSDESPGSFILSVSNRPPGDFGLLGLWTLEEY
jgi:hypothetical protein